jgi:Xaa-Pro aminopeptidase
VTLQEAGHTEYSVGEVLARMRAANDGFVDLSFGSIAGYQANGALPHYVAGPEAALELQPEGMFLLDSGGQYEDGTTDTTRTAYLGAAPSAHQKRCCALLTDTQIHTSLS